jgi:uncharacterized protein
MKPHKNQPDYASAENDILSRLEQELTSSLVYHGYHHTLDVMQAAMQIADEEKISEEEKMLLRIAVAFHDSGFIYVYKDHEEKGCEMAKETLPSYGFSEEQINIICGMIRATKIPQQPKNKLEKIIADADIDYLGREDVVPIAKSLFTELKLHANLNDEKLWNEIQVNFLKNHQYHTDYSLKVRAPKKQEYLDQLKEKKK